MAVLLVIRSSNDVGLIGAFQLAQTTLSFPGRKRLSKL